MYFFSDSGWDDNDAKVVCRMMGFETDYAKSTRHSAFGELQTSFVLTNVACNGTEDSIRDCASKSHVGSHLIRSDFDLRGKRAASCDPVFEDCSANSDDSGEEECDPVFEDCVRQRSSCDPIFENCDEDFEEVCDPIFEDCSPKPPLIIDGCGTANVGGVVCYSK